MSAKTAGIEPERLARALGLLAFLLAQSTERVALGSIATALGMSRAEIEEDVSLLNLVNFGGGTYLLYAFRDGEDLVVERDLGADAMAYPARLSPTLARSVILALDLVGHVLPLQPGEAHALRDKLALLLDQPGDGAATGSLTPAAPEVLESLAGALRERSVIRIEYFTPARDELAQRDIEPHQLWSGQGAWYLEAYCLRSRSARTFRVDRIRSAQALPVTFTPRPELASATAADAIEQFGTRPHWALIRQPAERAPLLEEQGTPFTREEDGSLLVHLPYFDREWLLGEILADAGCSVVLEPLQEAAAVARAARDLLQTYTEA